MVGARTVAFGREDLAASACKTRSASCRPIAIEWPLLEVQRSDTSQDDEWQIPVAAVIGLQNLTGCSQSQD